MAESTAFPWLKHLPEDAQREFFEELSNAFGEAQLHTMPGVLVSPETYVEVLDPLLASWKATAEVHADPELYRALTQDGGFDEGNFEEAPRPEGRLLSCGLCYEENGEEVHPHPECSVGARDAFDEVLPRTSPEDAAKALEKLYGGDWTKHIIARQSGPDYVIPTQREAPEEGIDCG